MPQPSKATVQQKMQQKFGQRSARTGGKGSVRRKVKAVAKSSNQDDKRLMAQLKKLNVSPIPAIEEVNLFKEDNTVVHFTKPKVQAEISSNTYVVSGTCETKKLEELIPAIIPQLGTEHIDSLKSFANTFNALNPNAEDDDEDDVPELVNENFEEVAARDAKKTDDTNAAEVDGAKDDDGKDTSVEKPTDDVPDLVQNKPEETAVEADKSQQVDV